MPNQPIRLDLQMQVLALAAVLAPPMPAMALDMQVTALASELQPVPPLMALVQRQPQAIDAALLPLLVGEPGPPGDAGPTNPVFTWSGGVLSAVTYGDGSTKALIWSAGRLEQLDFARPGRPTVRKTFSYNPDGTLAAVTQSEV